jgi:hypothetical protein
MRRRATIALALILALVAAFALAACGPSSVDTAKMNAALDSLSRLQSKVEAGIVYDDYSSSVGDTKGAVDLFTESATASKAYPDVAKALGSAMDAYVGASAIWNAKIQMASAGGGDYPEVQFISSWPNLVAEFPGLKGDLTASPDAVDADKAIQTLWTAASGSISKAKTAASK